MYIIEPATTVVKKKYTDNRGGFGTVARRAKAQTIRKYMSFLYKQQKWMIATTLSSRKNRKYHKVTAGDFDNTIVNVKKRDARLYYVVLPSTESDTDAITINSEECLDKYFNINYNDLMSEIVALQKEKGIDALPSYDIKKLLLNNSTINKKNMTKMIRNNSDGDNIHDDMVVDSNTEEKANDEESDDSGDDSDDEEGDDDLAMDSEDNNNKKLKENNMIETINTNENGNEIEKKIQTKIKTKMIC